MPGAEGARGLLPPSERLDLYEAYRVEAARPWLRLNMVSSADGAAQDRHGRTENLGGKGDQELFRVLRALADVILVGAGTVRVEGYGPHRVRADLAERRKADGRPDPAPIAVVSRSLDLDLDAPLFTEAATRTVVLTCTAAPDERRAAADKVARVVVCGEAEVDLAAGLAVLRDEHGLHHVLCEGGPTLNAGLVAGGLVDELCLTVSPQLVGGDERRIMDPATPPGDLRLVAVAEQAGELFLRYEVRR